MEQPSIKSADDLDPVTPEWLNDAESERKVASMEFWYPRLESVSGINTPETAWVALEPDVVEEGTIHEHYWARYDTEELRDAVTSVGGPPAFLRTDQTSDIYNMESSSRINSLSTGELEQSAGGVIGFNVTRAEVPFCSLAVREWLEIEHLFTAWNGKKIGVELRFFVSDGSVDGWCFDWPKSQIRPDEESWESKYDETKSMAEKRADAVIPQAQTVAERFKHAGSGAWSVDFVLTENDTWYCTDMAPKRMSQTANEVHEV
jgi:hypothetical protein